MGAKDHLIQLGIVPQLLPAEIHVPGQLVRVPGQGTWRLQGFSIDLQAHKLAVSQLCIGLSSQFDRSL